MNEIFLVRVFFLEETETTKNQIKFIEIYNFVYGHTHFPAFKLLIQQMKTNDSNH